MNPKQEKALSRLFKGQPLNSSLDEQELRELREQISMDNTLYRTVGFEFELYTLFRRGNESYYVYCQNILRSHGLQLATRYSKGSALDGWAVTSDGSIRTDINDFGDIILGEDDDDEDDYVESLEIVSPILTTDNFEEELGKISKFMHELLDNGQYKFQFNSSCGQHIHVGKDGLSKAQCANIRLLMYLIQDQIAYYILPSNRENTYYARKLPLDYVTRDETNFNDRYYMMAERQHTFEFRLFNMTRRKSSLIRRALLVDRIIKYGAENPLTVESNVSLIKDVLQNNVWLVNYLMAVRKRLLTERKRFDANLIPLP